MQNLSITHRGFLHLSFIFLGMVILSACASTPTIPVAINDQSTNTPTQISSATTTPTTVTPSTYTPSVEMSPTSTPSSTPTSIPVSNIVDEDFHPTDPASVNLLSGQPQLIEFFAYW
jgi:hypothetical protein